MNIEYIKSIINDQSLLDIISIAESQSESEGIPVSNILMSTHFVREHFSGKEWYFDDFKIKVNSVKTKVCDITEVYTGDVYNHENCHPSRLFIYLVCKIKVFKYLKTKVFLEGTTRDSSEFKSQKKSIENLKDSIIEYVSDLSDSDVRLMSDKLITVLSGESQIDIQYTEKTLSGIVLRPKNLPTLIDDSESSKPYQIINELSKHSTISKLRENFENLVLLSGQLKSFTTELAIEENNQIISDKIRELANSEEPGCYVEFDLDPIESLEGSSRKLIVKRISKIVNEIRIINESKIDIITEYYYRFKNLNRELPNVIDKVNKLYMIMK